MRENNRPHLPTPPPIFQHPAALSFQDLLILILILLLVLCPTLFTTSASQPSNGTDPPPASDTEPRSNAHNPTLPQIQTPPPTPQYSTTAEHLLAAKIKKSKRRVIAGQSSSKAAASHHDFFTQTRKGNPPPLPSCSPTGPGGPCRVDVRTLTVAPRDEYLYVKGQQRQTSIPCLELGPLR